MGKKIDKLISKIELKKRKEALAERKEERVSDLRFRNEQKSEKEKFSNKIELLNKISNWADEFSKSSRFKKIIKIRDCYSDLIIFYSCWGHFDEYDLYEYGEKNTAMWARIHMDKKGNLEYKWGYKWMGMHHFYLNEKNIDKIKYKFLKELWNHIDSGKVLDTIKNEIKRSV